MAIEAVTGEHEAKQERRKEWPPGRLRPASGL